MTLKITGLDNLKKTIESRRRTFKQAYLDGTYAAGQDIMLDARARAPVKDDWLRPSGYVAKTANGVEMGFGGAAEAYVVRQHEDLSLNHPNGGEAKFFERAIDANRDQTKEIIATYVRAAMGGAPLSSPQKKVPETPIEERGASK